MGIFNRSNKKDLMSNGNTVRGIVTDVKKCWWIKVKTKPVLTSYSDGVKYPHTVHYEYEVMGEKYTGSKTLGYMVTPPNKNAYITVYYDIDDPSESTIKYP
ncbi:MAG: hypothetical protein E7235_02880 [Lachnospiraceae bacterium]|nr:hypothetical protein [Lachnospiraceae bacterium]